MDNLVPERKMLDSRLGKFLNEIRDICRSSISFRKKIDVDVGHIAFRQEQSSQGLRGVMNNELIASVIQHGCVKESSCKLSYPLELVIEGRFAELSYTTYPPVTEHKVQNVGMRIVVRQGSKKHLVVTVYPLNESYSVEQIQAIVEVPNDIW